MTQLLTFAQTIVATAVSQCGRGNICDTGLPKIDASTTNLQVILQLLFGTLAIVAVIIIVVWGGLRFITESSNPQEIAKARNTIIYASIGLVIAISGELIVSFVLVNL